MVEISIARLAGPRIPTKADGMPPPKPMIDREMAIVTTSRDCEGRSLRLRIPQSVEIGSRHSVR